MMETAGPAVLADNAEAVDVLVAYCAPVFELDAQLERRLRGAHEILLVDPEQLVKRAEQRDRGLADADGTDLIRLDERDIEILAQQLAERGCGHPAGRAAADDHDLADVLACSK